MLGQIFSQKTLFQPALVRWLLNFSTGSNLAHMLQYEKRRPWKKRPKRPTYSSGTGLKIWLCFLFFVAHQGNWQERKKLCFGFRLHPWNTNLMIFNNSSIVVLAYQRHTLILLAYTKPKGKILHFRSEKNRNTIVADRLFFCTVALLEHDDQSWPIKSLL